MRHALKGEEEPYNRIEVRSAGIAAGDGYRPTSDSVTAMKKVGISLEDHVSKKVTMDDLLAADYVFAMTRGHLAYLRNLVGEGMEDSLFLMREFLEDTYEAEIPDPYGLGFFHYENARDSMVEAIPGIVNFLKSELTGSR